MTLKVESFDMFHIGTKVNPAVNLDILTSKLREALAKEGYSVPTDSAPMTRPQLLPPVELLAVRNGVRIEMNYVSFAINAIGTSPPEVTKVFSDLPHILLALGYELDALVQFFEVLANIVVVSDSKPVDILTKIVKWHMKGFDDMGDLRITALRTSAEKSEKDRFALIIQPNPTSPNSRILLQLQYRSDKKEPIERFQQTINERLSTFLSSLGG